MSKPGTSFGALRRLELGPSVRFIIGVALVMILLFPIYWLVVTAMENALANFHNPPYLFPPHPTLTYFGQVWGVQAHHLLTSLVVACGTVVLSLAVALPAGYALSQLDVKWTGVIVMVLLITQMIPNVVLGVPYYLLFEKLHLLNSYEGLVLADSSYAVPFVIVVLRAFLVGFPKEYARVLPGRRGRRAEDAYLGDHAVGRPRHSDRGPVLVLVRLERLLFRPNFDLQPEPPAHDPEPVSLCFEPPSGMEPRHGFGRVRGGAFGHLIAGGTALYPQWPDCRGGERLKPGPRNPHMKG